jgi:uncharacterized protein (TIGR03084 family)
MPAEPSAFLAALLADLVAESSALREILDPLPPPRWRLPTPAANWSIADQVSHLAFFDEAALASMTDPERFRRDAAALAAVGDDFPDRVAAEHRHLGAAELLSWFTGGRRALVDGYAGCDPAARLPWYGPDMGPASSITARLMETWAHGQDVADGLGVARVPTDRLRHVAHIGVGARAFSYATNGRDMPEGAIRVELTGPSGDTWTWGPSDAGDVVAGPAIDFCLVVTQRRHIDDTDLVVTGALATDWIALAQAFAGPPGAGRKPGQFA